MKKNEDSNAFSEVKHKHDDLVTSLHNAHVHKSIIYVITRLAKSTQQQVIPQHNTQTRVCEKPVIFLIVIYRDVMFVPVKTLLIQKVSSPVKSAIL